MGEKRVRGGSGGTWLRVVAGPATLRRGVCAFQKERGQGGLSVFRRSASWLELICCYDRQWGIAACMSLPRG
eukprot:1160997-Pelagomonas_calceolata.AAC.26